MQTCQDLCDFKTSDGWCGLTFCIKQKPITKLQFVYTSDVVNVVRCKDCKHYFPEKGSCNLHDERGADGEIEHRFYVTADWYCADGERRESE